MLLSQKSLKYLSSIFMVGVCTVVLSACIPGSGGETAESDSPTKVAESSVPACEEPFSPAPDPLNMTLDKTETFGAQDDAYTLSYPTQGGWEVTDHGDAVTMFVNLRKFEVKNVMSFMVTPNGAYMTMDQYGEGILNGLKANPNFELVSDCMTEINGMPARKIVWTGDSGSFKNVKGVEYLLIKGEKAFRVQFESSVDYFDKYVGSAEKIISSLQIN